MIARFHEANRRRWNASAASWARRADTPGIWRKCHRDPSLALHLAELEWLRDIAGDISERQVDVARTRAAALGLRVDFVCADVVDLSSLGDATYDRVYTGGHVALWVADLRAITPRPPAS